MKVKDLADSDVINIKAIGKVWLILSILTITKRGRRKVLVLNVASVS
jgi:hypothetical protein